MTIPEVRRALLSLAAALKETQDELVMLERQLYRRPRLIAQIRNKPAPATTHRPETLAQTEARWQRQGRLTDARRVLAQVEGNAKVAAAIGTTTRTVCYWRAGAHSPSVRHWLQLCALAGLLFAVRMQVLVIDRQPNGNGRDLVTRGGNSHAHLEG